MKSNKENDRKRFNKEEVSALEEYCCSISLIPFTEIPDEKLVQTSDRHLYHKDHIEQHFRTWGYISPITKKTLNEPYLSPAPYAVHEFIKIISKLEKNNEMLKEKLNSISKIIHSPAKVLNPSPPAIKFNEKKIEKPPAFSPGTEELLREQLLLAIRDKKVDQVTQLLKETPPIALNKPFEKIYFGRNRLFDGSFLSVLVAQEEKFDERSSAIADQLLEKKADINFPDFNGETPLHWAAFYKSEQWVKYLLEHNADPTKKNSSDQLIPRETIPKDHGQENSRSIELLLSQAEELQDIQRKKIGSR